jgi:hypothetical protein
LVKVCPDDIARPLDNGKRKIGVMLILNMRNINIALSRDVLFGRQVFPERSQIAFFSLPGKTQFVTVGII